MRSAFRAAALCLLSLLGAAGAGTIPASNVLYFQTSGRERAPSIGDWYTTATSSSTTRWHRFEIIITADQLATLGGSVVMTVNDAESNGSNFPADEVLNSPDPTRFTLKDAAGTTPTTGLTLRTTTYASNTNDGATFTHTFTTAGTYYLYSETGAFPISGNTSAGLNDDDNSFTITIGTATYTPVVGQYQSSFAQSAATSYDVYFQVPEGTPGPLRLRNFDLDSGPTVTYERADGTSVTGTASGNGVWNGPAGSLDAGFDSVPINGSFGWWRARIGNIAAGNQGIYEMNDANNVRLPSVFMLANNLGLTKTVDNAAPAVGSNVTFTITLSNPGTVGASGIRVRDLLPAGLTYVSHTLTVPAGSLGGYSPGNGLLTVRNLPASSSATLRIVARVDTTTRVTNTATLEGSDQPFVATSASASVAALPGCASVLAVGNSGTAAALYEVNPSTGALGAALLNLTHPTAAAARAPGNGRIYYAAETTSSVSLRYYDPATGTDASAGTFTGVTGTIARMAVNAAGTGHAMTTSGQLFTFTTSGSTSTVTALGTVATNTGTVISGYSSGDMAFDGSGNLWAVMTETTSGQAVLFRINPSAATATLVDRVRVNGAVAQLNVNGLAFDGSGRAYLTVSTASGTGAYAFDLAAATATLIGSTSTVTGDLASCAYAATAPVVTSSKTVTPARPVLAGELLTYSIVVRNSGSAPAFGNVLSDPIPANTTYLAGSTTLNGQPVADTSGSMPYATATAIQSPGAGPGVLMAGRDATVTFQVRVNASVPSGTTSISNQATVTYTGGPAGGVKSDDPAASGATDPTLTLLGADLQVTKTGPATTQPGAGITYTITARNHGLVAAQNVLVYDDLPAGVAFQGASGGGTLSGAVVSWPQVASLQPGAQVQYTVTVSAPDVQAVLGGTTSLTNVTRGATTTADPLPGNNDGTAVQARVTTTVVYVHVTKHVRNCGLNPANCSTTFGTVGVGLPGETLEYCITYHNAGGASVAGLVVRDAVPQNTSVIADAYAAGLGLGLTWTRGGSTTLLTSAVDADAGSIDGTQLALNVGSVAAGAQGTVCFRARIN